MVLRCDCVSSKNNFIGRCSYATKKQFPSWEILSSIILWVRFGRYSYHIGIRRPHQCIPPCHCKRRNDLCTRELTGIWIHHDCNVLWREMIELTSFKWPDMHACQDPMLSSDHRKTNAWHSSSGILLGDTYHSLVRHCHQGNVCVHHTPGIRHPDSPDQTDR